MAKFSKPPKVPRWADTGTVVEPSEAKKDTGWAVGEKPPHSFFNWLNKLTGDWLKWLDERLDDGVNENEFVLRNPNDGTIGIKIKSDGHLEIPGQVIDEDDLAINDVNFHLDATVANQRALIFDANDELRYNRTLDKLFFNVAGSTEMELSASGLAVTNGLIVGFSGTPADNTLAVGNSTFNMHFGSGTKPQVTFDANDRILYERTANAWLFQIETSNVMRVDASGVKISNGLQVGFTGGSPSNDEVQVGDARFAMDFVSGAPRIRFDSNDRIDYKRVQNEFEFVIDGSVQARLNKNRMQVERLELSDEIKSPSSTTLLKTAHTGNLIGSYGFLLNNGSVSNGYNISGVTKSGASGLYQVFHDIGLIAPSNSNSPPPIVCSFGNSDLIATVESWQVQNFSARVRRASTGDEVTYAPLLFIRPNGIYSSGV